MPRGKAATPPLQPADLVAWQARLGLSGRAAAQALGVTHGAFQHWLRGRRRIPAMLARAMADVERERGR